MIYNNKACNVKYCRDDAVLQFYQKSCALNIGL